MSEGKFVQRPARTNFQSCLFASPGQQLDISRGPRPPKNNQKPYSVLLVKRAGGRKSDRRRVWHSWNGGVVRVNVATLNRVALWISRTITRRPSSRLVHPSIRPPRKVRCRFGAGWAVQSEESRRVRGTVTLRKVVEKNFPRSVVVGLSLGFRLRPHKRRDHKARRDRQAGKQRKCVALRLTGRTKYHLGGNNYRNAWCRFYFSN